VNTLRRAVRFIEPHPGEHFKDKAIAVGLAFMVWFAVNTAETGLEIFQAVPVEVINLPPDLVFADDYVDTLNVRASGSVRDLADITPGRLSPVIDLSNAGAGDNIYQILPEDLGAPNGVLIERIEPPEIRITLEHRDEKYVPVSAVTSGEPAAGYEVVGRASNPETALIAGPRSLVAAQERIATSTVDVSGRRESFTQTVTLDPGNRLIELPGQRTVELRIDIVEQATTEQFDAIQVVVVNNRFRVDVNPTELSVVLSGPQSVLMQIDVEQMRMVIDAAELEPRAQDYLLEPRVEFARAGLGDLVEVVALYPQRRINVHVYDQPGRQ